MSGICVLWDDSHIWGLLVARALQGWSLPFRLVTGEEIAEGYLSRNPVTALVVPGGNARKKAASLGKPGINAVRAFVNSGGSYVGFCGGAGLGLADGGLKLCPWCRLPFENRLQHFVSGHLHATPRRGHELVPDALSESPQVPVWWPGRFDPQQGTDVTVLATYGTPGDDLWVADLPLSTFSEATFADWEERFGVKLRPEFMEGQPCLVEGRMGKGRYVLSYAHLETPDSPEANAWLAHILTKTANAALPADTTLPAWELSDEPEIWADPVLVRTRERLIDIIRVGHEHFLLFKRNPWLLGWRRGLPGLAVNSLYALIVQAIATAPSDAALAFWDTRKDGFSAIMDEFHHGVTGYLLAERLDMTLSHSPDALSVSGLREQRRALFGPLPTSGGLYGRLLETLERLTLLLLNSNSA